MKSAAAVIAVFLASACSQEIPALDPRNLDRPSDMAFACVGGVILDSGDIVSSGQPLANCFPESNCTDGVDNDFDGLTDCDDDDCDRNPPSESKPAGVCYQQPGPLPNLVSRLSYGFALQTETGTVALVDLNLPTGAGLVIDSDPFVPGKNAMPVGTLPVSIVADEAGCNLVVANAGTCDLSVFDPRAAIDQEPSVTRHLVLNASGDVVEAEPRMMVGEPALPASPELCPDDPTGLLYIAYPHCNAVAVVDPSEGLYEVVASIRFAADGTPSVGDGNLVCPAECGSADPTHGPLLPDAGPVDAGPVDAGPPDAAPPEPDASVEPPVDNGTPRPVSVLLSREGDRLYIGAENAPMLTIVTLDENRLPTGVSTVALEGNIGLRRMADTGPIEMGGALGNASFGVRNVGEHEFVYAIATDRTIRVIEVDDLMECDTQVDPRYVHDVTNAALFSCFEVGAVTTPPRRAGARGPGIPMPRGSVPLDLQTFDTNPLTVDKEGNPEPTITSATNRAPTTMVGHFAMVSTSDGFVHVINIDDDHYPDFESAGDPLQVHLPLTMAHQIRDNVTLREEAATTCSFTVNSQHDNSNYGPRSRNGVFRLFDTDFISVERGDVLLPRGRQIECHISTEDGSFRDGVSELDFAAPAAVREFAFPDVTVARNEEFLLTWEGLMSLDETTVNIDGPVNRVGIVLDDGPDVELVDGAAPFCEMGVEPYDVVQLLGCQIDAHCSLGEDCVFHPDSTVNTGLCFPTHLANQLVGKCRDLLVSTKLYTAVDAYAGHVTLAERRLLLQTGPIDGCTSDDQCTAAANAMGALTKSVDESDEILHPFTDVPDPPKKCNESDTECVPFQWACASDPSRKPGPNKCQMTCGEVIDSSTGQLSECPDGAYCSDGFCVNAPLPDTECLQALQRYNVRVGEAFSVVGAVIDSSRVTGFLHNRIVDPDTGQCIDDPDGNPLSIGRIPITGLPDCSGDGLADITPNPCMTTVTHGLEVHYEFDSEAQECVVVERETDADNHPILQLEEVPAIRFRNPVMTMHLVRPSTRGDLNCLGDEQGTLEPFSPLFPGYVMSVQIAGGFTPLFAPADVAFPVRMVKGPRGFFWVLDQGDKTTGTITRGQLVRVNPFDPLNAFGLGDPFAVIR